MDENEPPRVLASLAPVPSPTPPRTPSTDDDEPSDFEIIQVERTKSMDTSLKQSEGKLIHNCLNCYEDLIFVEIPTFTIATSVLDVLVSKDGETMTKSNTSSNEVKKDDTGVTTLVFTTLFDQTLDTSASLADVEQAPTQTCSLENMEAIMDAIVQVDQNLINKKDEPEEALPDYASRYAAHTKLRDMQVSRKDNVKRIVEVLGLIRPSGLPDAQRNIEKPQLTENIIFNAETLLIIELLTLKSSQRDIQLLKLAADKDMLFNAEVRPELTDIVSKINAHRNELKANQAIALLLQKHYLNEGNIIIIELLSMERGERGAHLLKLAEQRKILYRYFDSHMVNPRIKKLKSCLLLENFITKVDQFNSASKPTVPIAENGHLVVARNENMPLQSQPLLGKLNLQPEDDISKVLEGIKLVSCNSQDQSTMRKDESIRLNGENLMILDLLGLETDEEREDYILRLALQRKLLIINKDTLEPELNQSLLKFNSFGVIDINPCISSFKPLPLPNEVSVQDCNAALSERQLKDKDKYEQQGAIPKYGQLPLLVTPPFELRTVKPPAKSKITSAPVEVPASGISKKLRGKNPLSDSPKPGTFRQLSTNELDSNNVGMAKPSELAKEKVSKKKSKSVADSTHEKGPPPTFRTTNCDETVFGSMDMKLKLHLANEKLMQNLRSKMQQVTNEQNMTFTSETSVSMGHNVNQAQESTATPPQLLSAQTEDSIKKQRKRKDRGAKKSGRSQSTDESQASLMHSTENLANIAPTPRRADPTSAYNNSIFQMFDQINVQIDNLEIPENQLADPQAHVKFVSLVSARMFDLANKLNNKRHILKEKARNLKKVSKQKDKEAQLAPSYRNEVNRLHHDVTGQYSDVLPKFLQIENVNEFIIFNNRNAVEKFVGKMVRHGIGSVVEGEIRINAFNCQQAYISRLPPARDAMIRSILLRQCAMHGDIVRAFVYEKTGVSLQSNKTQEQANVYGFVMCIIEEKHDRQVLGHCSLNNNKNYVSVLPTNKRVPRIKIFKNSIQDMQLNDQMLYLIKITDWQGDQPVGTIIREIGDRNVLSTCNEAILIENKLEIPTFSESILNSLPSDTFVIPPEEYANRELLTSDCVFTIDPATARDLDDAMSCKKLANGNYEIGVHISDVTYFLSENSELDKLVKEQATSIYLVDRVYHMLPRSLCMTCSLLPGEDKLTFSVFWEISKDCRVISTRFAKTIIRSCVQLAYSHAQQMIEQPNRIFGPEELPAIGNGCTVQQISEIVNILHHLALVMRQARFDRLCIKIDQPKIYFNLDPDSGEPTSFEQYKQLEANSLIEEFMLFANQSVAAHIYKHYPDISILRNHAAPKRQSLDTLAAKLEQFHFKMNLSSAKTISESFYQIVNGATRSEAITCVLNDWLAKPMNRAE